MPGAASFLLRHRGSCSQAGRPRTLAHFLTASRSLWLALTPTSTHTRSHTHSLPTAPRSLSRLACARDPAYTQRARRRRRPPRAAPERGAACRARARAAAPPSRRDCAADAGRWVAGRGAPSASRPSQSGTNICNGTRPLGSWSPPAAIADLSGCGEAMERARWEGSGSARGLRGRAFPTRFQTVLMEEGKRVGVRGWFPTRNREMNPFRCTPSPPSHSLLGPHSSTL